MNPHDESGAPLELPPDPNPTEADFKYEILALVAGLPRERRLPCLRAVIGEIEDNPAAPDDALHVLGLQLLLELDEGAPPGEPT